MLTKLRLLPPSPWAVPTMQHYAPIERKVNGEFSVSTSLLLRSAQGRRREEGQQRNPPSTSLLPPASRQPSCLRRPFRWPCRQYKCVDWNQVRASSRASASPPPGRRRPCSGCRWQCQSSQRPSRHTQSGTHAHRARRWLSTGRSQYRSTTYSFPSAREHPLSSREREREGEGGGERGRDGEGAPASAAQTRARGGRGGRSF
eukprot:scaffold150236_cov36-Tisochrysis_lutea.AAC.3